MKSGALHGGLNGCAVLAELVANPSKIDAQVGVIGPTQIPQLRGECLRRAPGFHVALGQVRHHGDPAHAIALLRPRRNRPCRRAAEKRDELAPLHSITSSAIASTPGGMVRPSALAVLTLMANSNLVGCATGKSAGFSPLRIRPV
jgi:hypothetical protein